MNTEGLFQAALVYAEKVIISEQKQLAPTWTLINKEDEKTVLMTPWGSETEKPPR